MESGIYYILNILNSKIYIGSAVSIVKRWRVHKHLLHNGKHYNRHLQHAWEEYGEDTLLFGIIEYLEEKNMLLEREQYWIEHYDSASQDKGYNLRPNAGNMLGYKPSEATIRKLSLSHKGQIAWNKGKKMEGEYRENFLKAMRSDEVRAMRRKRKPFKHTDKTKKKMSVSASKRIVSEETKKKHSLNMLGKKLGEGHRQNCIKAWEKRKLKNKEA